MLAEYHSPQPRAAHYDAPMARPDPARLLQERLAARRRPERELAIGGIVGRVAQQARRTHDRLGELVELWESIVPAPLASRTRLTSLRGGVLHVDVDCPATLYELDRLLRGGAEARLRADHQATLTRIRLKVADMGEASPPRRPRS